MKTTENKTNESKPKRGTIGFAVRGLVKRYGHYPAGLIILEMAVREAVGASDASFRVQDCSDLLPLTQTPGWIKAKAAEDACFDRMGWTMCATCGNRHRKEEQHVVNPSLERQAVLQADKFGDTVRIYAKDGEQFLTGAGEISQGAGPGSTLLKVVNPPDGNDNF